MTSNTRKKKKTTSNAELDRSIRQKTEEESQEKIEEQNPELKPYMEEEKQPTKMERVKDQQKIKETLKNLGNWNSN